MKLSAKLALTVACQCAATLTPADSVECEAGPAAVKASSMLQSGLSAVRLQPKLVEEGVQAVVGSDSSEPHAKTVAIATDGSAELHDDFASSPHRHEKAIVEVTALRKRLRELKRENVKLHWKLGAHVGPEPDAKSVAMALDAEEKQLSLLSSTPQREVAELKQQIERLEQEARELADGVGELAEGLSNSKQQIEELADSSMSGGSATGGSEVPAGGQTPAPQDGTEQGAGGGNDDSCRWSHDSACDEPTHCRPGTDCTDCGNCGGGGGGSPGGSGNRYGFGHNGAGSNGAGNAAVPSVEEQKEELLDLHNKYRCMHDAPLLDWDAGLAVLAQTWAEQAESFGGPDAAFRNYNGQSAGDNIAWGRPSRTGVQATHGWYDEIENTPGGTGKVTTYSCRTQDYTKVVWKASTKLGCGHSKLNDGDFWVCLYWPGNSMGSYPQNVGELSKSEEQCQSSDIKDVAGGASLAPAQGDTNPTPVQAPADIPEEAATGGSANTGGSSNNGGSNSNGQAGAGGGNDDSCRYSHDHACDEPQYCRPGTDCTDCGNCGTDSGNP